MAKKKKKKKKGSAQPAVAKRTLTEKIAARLHTLYETQNEIAGELDCLQAELPGLDHIGLGDLVLVLDDLKEDQESGLKVTNGALAAVHESFCTSLMDDGIFSYPDHKHATFTANVKGHFTIKSAEAFYAWLAANIDDVCERMEGLREENQRPFLEPEHLDAIDTSIDLFLACSARKREMRAVCESQLENGLSLPDGVTAFIQQKVGIRRKGQKGQPARDEF